MPTGVKPVNLILSIATVLLALIAGFMIPLISGGGFTREASPWTPPPSVVATTLRPALATVIPAPETTPLPSPTPEVAPTATPKPTATPEPTVPPTPTSESTAAPTAAAGPIVTILADLLNLRAGPGITYAALTTATTGETYELVGRSADGAWHQVCCVQAAPAWVSAAFVSVIGAIDTVPIVP